MIIAESLRGLPPEEVLKRVGKKLSGTSVTINTVSLYKEAPGRKILLDPQAGIQIKFANNKLEVHGLTYKGNTPHFTEQGEIPLPEALTIEKFLALKELAKTLAGYKPQVK